MRLFKITACIPCPEKSRTQRELREANAKLEHTVSRFADFAHAASDWFWETDAAGRYVHMSEGVSRIGAQPDDVIGLTRAEARRALAISPIGADWSKPLPMWHASFAGSLTSMAPIRWRCSWVRAGSRTPPQWPLRSLSRRP